MAISYTQTDNTSPVCSVSLNLRTAEEGGTAGSSEVILTIGTVENNATSFTAVPADGVSFEGGSLTFRLNITSSSMTVSWTRLLVERYDSSCLLQETLGDFTSLGISLNSTGVVSTTQTIAAASAHNAGDRIVFRPYFTATMSSQSVGYTPDQDIDTPFTAVAGHAPLTVFRPYAPHRASSW